MKHNIKITAILLGMFLITQLIGLAVVNSDIFHLKQEVNGTIEDVPNPHLSWIEPPPVETEKDFSSIFIGLMVAFAIAISLLFLLSKFKFKFIIKLWFFVVVSIALFLTIYAFEKIFGLNMDSSYVFIIPLIIALPLAFIKIYGKSFLVHNLTELFIYPGIATIFVPILNLWTVIILLIIISIYDMWAVWHSGIMQKMAKFQINKLNIFSGFFVPYLSKKLKMKIKKLKKIKKSKLKNQKVKVNLAILGGGDVIFPIIAAGVVLKTFGLGSALFVTAGALLGLAYLFFFSEKKKFYPAMPFITAGIFLGMILSRLILN